MEKTTPAQVVVHSRWLTTRTVLSGAFIAGVGALYYGIVAPIANTPIPSDYRFPFSYEANIYLAFVAIYGLHFVFRLARPKATPEAPPGSKGGTALLGAALRALFLLVVGGSYLTGAMVATPALFSFAPNITGNSVVIFAQSLHDLFATLIIALGTLIVINEVVRVVRKKQTMREWLVSARYPEIKLLYWGIAILVVVQGAIGLFLLGSISPVGPFGIVANNVYGFETLLRHIHGPMGAVIISVFYGHVYLRLRPEYSLA